MFKQNTPLIWIEHDLERGGADGDPGAGGMALHVKDSRALVDPPHKLTPRMSGLSAVKLLKTGDRPRKHRAL